MNHIPTPGQLRCLELVAQGYTDNQIGTRLNISPKTSKAHVTQAMHILGARSRTHAVVLALHHGLIDCPCVPLEVDKTEVPA